MTPKPADRTTRNRAKDKDMCVCSRCARIRQVCCSESFRTLSPGMHFLDGEILAQNGREVYESPVCVKCCPRTRKGHT